MIILMNAHRQHIQDGVPFPARAAVFFIVSLSKGLSQCFMCFDQHAKYWMPRGFPLTSSLLLDYHIKQYIHTNTHTVTKLCTCVPIFLQMHINVNTTLIDINAVTVQISEFSV